MESSYNQKPLCVAVVMGGRSSERDVSLASGAAVAAALRQSGHHVQQIDPLQTELPDYNWTGIDAAFLTLHGWFGEDGQVQEILEAAGVPYTGSGPAASRLAFSKSATKECLRRAGVPTPEYALIHSTDRATRLRSMAEDIGYPVVIKPDQQGSSLGVSVVHSSDHLPLAVRNCFRFGPFGIMERAVTGGSEWTVGLRDALPLPLVKIIPRNGFFDFSAKYEDERTGYLFDFDETQDVTTAILRAGMQAGRAVSTCGIARIDILTDDVGRPWVLEVNTIPGMTTHSLIPKAAARAGISLPQLCETEVRFAIRRHQCRHDGSDRCELNSTGMRLRAG